MSDCHPSGYSRLFNENEACRNLRAYERKGLDKVARRLVDASPLAGSNGESLAAAPRTMNMINRLDQDGIERVGAGLMITPWLLRAPRRPATRRECP
jgi:hypothetical protein